MTGNGLILIADGDPDHLQALAAILEGRYQLRLARSGAEVLLLARQEPLPELILLDLHLQGQRPGLDGHDVCRELKRDELTHPVPVILVSSRRRSRDQDRDQDEVRSFEAGAVDYLARPLSPPVVLARIANQLRLAQLITRAGEMAIEVSEHLLMETHARVRSEELQQRTQEFKAATFRLLESALKPMSLQQQLELVLEVVGGISWVPRPLRAAIFLAEPGGTLVMLASRQLEQAQHRRCARIEPGLCLCGQAAVERQIAFQSRIEPGRITNCAELEPHGHYLLPLMEDQRLIGLFKLILPAGYQRMEGEDALMAELAKVLGEVISRRSLESRYEVSRFELEDNYREIIRTLCTAAELRDNETGLHILRIGHYAARLAAAIGLPPDEQETILLTAPMHDVGKIGVPDRILLKPGRLTPDEYAEMQSHTTIGAKILSSNAPLITAARTIALTHHEQWDGSGYPAGLAGEQIPLHGRLCAIADVFDALTMARPYKQPWPLEQAVEHIRSQAGRHFDPTVVAAFLECLPELLAIKETYADGAGAQGAALFVRPLSQTPGPSPLWRDEYAIGVPRIDEQHQLLFSLIDRLEHALSQRRVIVEICLALKELESYVYFHFAEEERLMSEQNYPRFAAHKLQHQGFERQIAQAWGTVRDNAFLAGLSLIKFLRAWLKSHILREDMELKRLG